MSQEKNKIICISLGINETKVLKYLNKNDDFVSFEQILEVQQPNVSLVYPLQLSHLLGRLLRKKLIMLKEPDSLDFVKISEKGKMMLKILKKE